MTQELVMWALLMALVGLMWVFTCMLLTKDRPAKRIDEDEDKNFRDESNTQQRCISHEKAAA